MKFFVTGSSGLLGSNFVRLLYLADKTPEADGVVGLDINFGGFTDKVISIKRARETGLLKSLIENCDVVVHFASHLGVENIVNDTSLPFKTFKNDKTIVDLAIKYNKKIVYLSTSEVYGDSKDYAESSDLIISSKLRSNYALEKLFMERYIQSKTDNYLIIRPFNVYGIGQNPNNGFIAKAISAAFNPKEVLKIRAGVSSINSAADLDNTSFDPTTKRCYCHVNDFNNILYKLIVQNIGGVFNIGNPFAIATPLDIIKIIGSLGYDVKFQFEPVKDPNDYEIQKRVPNIDKLREVIDLNPEDFTDLKTGIIRILDEMLLDMVEI